MGPEVEYFPNVSAICATLQLNAIILVPGAECQCPGCDGVTNGSLTGGMVASRLLGAYPAGNEWWHCQVQQVRTRGGSGDRQGPARGPMCYVCAHRYDSFLHCHSLTHMGLEPGTPVWQPQMSCLSEHSHMIFDPSLHETHIFLLTTRLKW